MYSYVLKACCSCAFNSGEHFGLLLTYCLRVVDSEMMETDYPPYDVPGSSNSGDLQNLENVASRPAAERDSTTKLGEAPVIRRDISSKPMVREAWEEPDDRRQEDIMYKFGNQTQNRRRNRKTVVEKILWISLATRRRTDEGTGRLSSRRHRE